MPITPSEAVTAAFRAAELELARGVKTTDFDEWLQSVAGHLSMAGQVYTQVAMQRPKVDIATIRALEREAYMAVLRVAVAGLLALGNFPALHHMAEPCPGEKLT